MTVRLMREPGEPVKSTTDMHGFVAHCVDAGEWRVLGQIDDYGDTFFGRSQMADLLADWDGARALVRSFADENCWHKVRALAVECESGVELYLQFVGD
jgi:hypothetical protein